MPASPFLWKNSPPQSGLPTPWNSALPAATAPLLVRFRRAPKWGQQVPRTQTRLLRRRLQFLQRIGFPINALFGAKHAWEIFVSHWLPPPSQSGTPARVPKPLPCLGSPQAAVAASFRVQVQYCCNFSGKLKKKKKELRAGGCEGERAKGRCRGVKGSPTRKRGSCAVLSHSRESYQRAASQPAWGQPALYGPRVAEWVTREAAFGVRGPRGQREKGGSSVKRDIQVAGSPQRQARGSSGSGRCLSSPARGGGC